MSECVRYQIFCSGCCYFLRVLERLQTFLAADKNCLLLINVFFPLLESGKGLWFAKKVCFETVRSYSPSARVFVGIK